MASFCAKNWQSLAPDQVLADEDEEEMQRSPNPLERFVRSALMGFTPVHMKKLQAGKTLKFRAKRAFKTRNRGFGFRRGDVLKIKIGEKGAFIIDDNDRTTKGIILHKGAHKMGIVVIERGTNFKKSGRLLIGKKTLALGRNFKKMAPKKMMLKGMMHKKKAPAKKMMH